MKYIIGSHVVEHLTPSDNAILLCNKMTDGKIIVEEAVQTILEKYNVSQRKHHV